MSRPLTGIPADRKQSYASIEQVACAFRVRIGLDAHERFDALRFFNEVLGDLNLGSQWNKIPVIECVEDCAQEGLTRWDHGKSRLEVVLAERTFDMLLSDHVRARSTVAHETGHAVLHTAQIIRLAGMNLKSQVAFHRERNPHSPCQDTEWQANAFSSSLLMPATGVLALSEKRTFNAGTIANAFGVSLESANYRLETFRKSLGQ